MRRSFLIPVLAALVGAVVITGQSASQVNPGARVRVQVRVLPILPDYSVTHQPGLYPFAG